MSVRPFLAVRTRWAKAAGGAEFRRALKDGARELARQAVDEALTPASAGGQR